MKKKAYKIEIDEVLEQSEMLYSGYWKEHTSGIVSLLINVNEKHQEVFRSSNEVYRIRDSVNEKYERVLITNVPDKLKKGGYLVTEARVKDQASFYWIPFDMIK